MKAIKQHNTYNALHHCLEAHFGSKHSTPASSHREYREADQGPRTVLFQSRYPLQLDYMARRRPCRTETARRFTQIFSLLKNNQTTR